MNLAPTTLHHAETKTTAWYINAPPGTTLKLILDPDFWAHVAGRLLRTPNRGIADRIRVWADDGTLDAEVTVIAVDPREKWVQVRKLWAYEAEKSAVPANATPDKDGYTVKFSGPQRWCVIDALSDIVAEGLPDEAAANAELVRIKAAKRAPKAA